MSLNERETDVILVGAGIMSATLATLLKELDPDVNIKIFEKLNRAGEESSNAWNNAGTGHSGLCELNYTKQQSDGTIDIQKAVQVNEEFQLSKQFWSYLLEKGLLEKPSEFINQLPHMSLVHGDANISFLKRRYERLSQHPLFDDMTFSDDPETLKKWMPLIMQNRDTNRPVAATKVDSGTDIDFGALTRKLFEQLEAQDIDVQYNHRVEDMKRLDDGRWEVKVRNHTEDTLAYHCSKFVFIGGGGGALPLLQKSGIPESKHFGGFPVSGVFLVCNNSDVIEQHYAKVYGKAAVGAPPMSVPHLDTRYIDGKKTILFGPFAGFSPRFLKTGSLMDLPGSVKPNNALTMLAGGAKNLSLTKYLVGQLLLSKEQRIDQLREFIPDAKAEDWDVVTAGQRVQIIKDTDHSGKGTLQFGTEVVTAEDGSIAALLGASPGASTAVSIMLDVMEKCYPDKLPEWEAKLKEMIPSYGLSLAERPDVLAQINAKAADALGIKNKDADKTMA